MITAAIIAYLSCYPHGPTKKLVIPKKPAIVLTDKTPTTFKNRWYDHFPKHPGVYRPVIGR